MSIFGQNPADITGAVFKAKNLADVPDKAAARTNLDVPSKAEVQYNSVPVGMILPYWGTVAPVGYVPCSGQTVTSASFPELVTFLGGTTSAVVPDLRGEFLRGWDNGRGVDVGRSAKDLQLDTLQNITGSTDFRAGISSGLGVLAGALGAFGVSLNGSGGTTSNTITRDAANSAVADRVTFDASRVARTSTETRPRNVSVLYCIKAYSSVTNFTSGLNIAGLVNDYSTLSAAAVKYADFTGTNQIKAPAGYQKLPGGTILQWGSATVAVRSTSVITFPLVFPTATLSLQCSIGQASVTPTSTPCAAIEPVVGSTSQATIQNAYSSSSLLIYWTAIGY